MAPLTRRSFIGATVGAVMSPARARALPATVDVAVVGAGAAGIAAARRVAAAGRSVVVLEASARIGGRCLTDTATFGIPCDLGARWLYASDANPVARLAPAAGVDIYPAMRGQRLRIGRRNAREGELEDFLAALVRCDRAIAGAAAGKADLSAAQALPKDLGILRPAIEFFMGPFSSGSDLSDISAADLAKAAPRNIDAFCRQGLGALIETLAANVAVERSTPVIEINAFGRAGVEIATARGRLSAQTVIVTASTNVLASARIRFAPELPKRQADAVSKLSLGNYERIVLELPGNPLDLQRDDLVLERAESDQTAALLANVNGSALCFVDVGGRFGRALAMRGPRAMTEFAVNWLSGLYGVDVGSRVRRSHVTQWSSDPWIMGATAAAAVGAQASRRILMEPYRDRVFFAGEAVHETLWGTVGGAWESGERAAAAALRRFGIGPKPQPAERRQPRRPAR